MVILVVNPASKDWLNVKEQLQYWIEAAKNELANAKSWDDVLRTQGRIAAFLSVISMETNPGAKVE